MNSILFDIENSAEVMGNYKTVAEEKNKDPYITWKNYLMKSTKFGKNNLDRNE